MYGHRLRSLRKERKWTINDVAEKLEIGVSTYSGYENEARQPPIDKIQRMAELFEVSTDYIIGLTNDREPHKFLESNLYEYLNKENLHWNGKPLTDSELKPIKDLLEVVVRDRMPSLYDEKEKAEQKRASY